MKDYTALLLVLLLPISVAASIRHPATQHHEHDQDKRLDEVNRRGDHAMGFSHEKTTHHFRLTVDGGVIEVVANDPKDETSIEQIRIHLSHIAKLFKDGNFSAPMLTHGETPAGVPEMTRLKSDITYTFESFEPGGRVRIVTSNEQAIEAIHQFLRYQIKDHKTGDSLEVDKHH